MMKSAAAFFHWLGTPFRAVRSWFPFTHDGRQTLIYLMFSLSTGIITLVLWWAMDRFFDDRQWHAAQSISDKLAWALLISVGGYACFVSVRAITIGKDGFGMQALDPQNGTQPTATTETTTKTTISQPSQDNGGEGDAS